MTTSPNSSPMILLKNVSKSYLEAGKRKLVLNKINLEVHQGDIIVLLGKSGSGKSTLLNLISGIDTSDEGSVNLLGLELNRLSEEQRTLFRRKNIGIIFQFFNLVPTLTVGENLLFPLQLIGDKNPQKALSLLEQLQLLPKKESYPDTLSGGEQQRIAIARALIHEPAILLADEATGNLDEETSNQVVELIHTFVRKKKVTLIMATHNLEIVKIADRVLSIKKGELVDITATQRAEIKARKN